MDNIDTINKVGAPIGNQNATKGKRWSDAIDRALAKRCKGDGIKALDELAEKLLLKADDGDMAALRELGDRLEGKPSQSIALGGPGENGEIITKMVIELVEPSGG